MLSCTEHLSACCLILSGQGDPGNLSVASRYRGQYKVVRVVILQPQCRATNLENNIISELKILSFRRAFYYF